MRIRFFSKLTEYLMRFNNNNNALSPIENAIENKMQLIVGKGCTSWTDKKFKYDPLCVNYMKQLGYKDGSVRDLVRLQRNVYQHFEEIKSKGYTDFGNYIYEVEGVFRHRYPQLLMCMHEVVEVHAQNDFPEFF